MKKTVKTTVMAAVLAAVTACSAGTMAMTAFAAEKHPGECGYNYVNEYGKHPGEAGYNYHEENEEDVNANGKHPGECGYNYVNEYGKHPGEAGYNYHEENEEDVNANGKHPGECGYNYVNEYGKHPGESGYGYKEMPTAETKKSVKTVELKFDAYDWNYSAESTNAKITCEFDYAAKNARFIATGTKAGITKAVLKVKNAEGKWHNIPVTFTVDNDLNVSVKQTGDMFTTEK